MCRIFKGCFVIYRENIRVFGGNYRVWSYLQFGQSTLVAYQQQVAAVIDENLLLKPATLGRFLLHVGAGQVPMHERRFARIEGANDAQSQIGHGP